MNFYQLNKLTMISKAFFSAILIVMGFFQDVNAQNPFHLDGSIPTEYDGKTIHLRIMDRYSTSGYVMNDSTKIANGKFEFKGETKKVAEKALLRIINQDGTDKFFTWLIIDSGMNIIKIAKIEDDYYANRHKNISIPSSPTNTLYKKLDSLGQKYYELNKLDTGASKKAILSERRKQKDEEGLRIIREHPDNFYSLILLRELVDMDSYTDDEKKIEAEFILLNSRLKNSPLGVELASVLKERITNANNIKLGNKVPTFSIKDFQGKTFTNASLKGRPYIIAFSATWCIPCQAQLPLFKKLYGQYKSKGLEIIYFNLDDRMKYWSEHIKKNKLQWVNVSERTKFRDSNIAKQFHIYAIPSCFLIDKEGKIVYNSDQMDIEMNSLENFIKKRL